VNVLDVVIVFMAISAAVGGYRLGLVARALSWTGLALGVVVGARLLPAVVEQFPGPDPSGRLMIAIAVLLAAAFIGQAVGLVLGSRLHVAIPPPAQVADQVGGALAGILGVLAAVWVLLPAIVDVPGEVALQARESAIARFVASAAPAPPDTLQALRRLVGDNQFPKVFDALRPTPKVGPPPAATGIPGPVLQAAIASTVKVEGPACGRIQEGSGFVVAPGVVVTNAHVVAGEHSTTTVLSPNGRRVAAVVVHFDPDRDLAVLRADVREPPLPIAATGIGTQGAVLGYPGGGDLRVSPFEVRDKVDAVGRDLYDRHQTRRRVLILASDLAPGDSGGALVDHDGAVVGVAFAIAPDRPGTAYALDSSELTAALSAPRSSDTDTGDCLR